MTDTQALQLYVRDQDADAFRHLVLTYQRLVYATARRCLGNDADAEDVTQETFLRLAKNAGRIRGAVGGWLHRCATHVAIDRIRSDSARRRREGATVPRDVGGGSSDAAEAQELTRAVDRAIAELKAADRAAVVGYYLQGRPQAELAGEAGITPAGMSKRIDRALARVRKTLHGRGVAAAAGAVAALLGQQSAHAQISSTLTGNLMRIGISGVGKGSITKGGLIMAASWSTGKVVTASVVAGVLLLGGVTAVVATRGPSGVAPSVTLGTFDVVVETVAPQTLVYSEHPFAETDAMRIGSEWFPALDRRIATLGYPTAGSPVLLFFTDPGDASKTTIQVAMPVHDADEEGLMGRGFASRRTEPFRCASTEFTGSPKAVSMVLTDFIATLTEAGYTVGDEVRMVQNPIERQGGPPVARMTIQVQVDRAPGQPGAI